ncbi:hypothetical protein NDU88_007914 [Pleurodeles waltl]|uniref:Uncharacterized protein n=1 Tax=Pleurodeles waltl TaxID=8319 RepID=A0AAV7RVE6_PLEWA|nr:hypothetical protein NDU88_007914 [Pleurodeles waltl]
MQDCVQSALKMQGRGAPRSRCQSGGAGSSAADEWCCSVISRPGAEQYRREGLWTSPPLIGDGGVGGAWMAAGVRVFSRVSLRTGNVIRACCSDVQSRPVAASMGPGDPCVQRVSPGLASVPPKA